MTTPVDIIIYHNPACGTSRNTLAMIRNAGIEPHVVEYLKTPPSADELRDVLTKLGLTARDVMRKGEAIYKELGLGDADKSEDDLVNAIVTSPILLERPIVVSGGKAVIGRPTENILKLI